MHPWLTALGWAVLSSFWQTGLLWLGGKLLQAAPFFSNARHRFNLNTALLFTGFAWFIITFIQSLALTSSGYNGTGPLPELPLRINLVILGYLPVLSVLYLLLLLIPVFRMVRNMRYVNLIRRFGLTRISGEWKIYVEEISRQLGIKRRVQIWISDFVSSPVTIGFLKPLILVPAAALSQLNTDQLEAVLLHELAHIRRFDYLLNLLVSFIRTLLYFNPFIGMMGRETEKDREISCDDLVLQFRYNAIQYASALLVLEKSSHSCSPLILQAAGKSPEFLHRIETILGQRKPQRISARRVAGSLLTIAFVMLFKFMVAVPEKKNTAEMASLAVTDTVSPVEFASYFMDTDNPVKKENKELTLKQKTAPANFIIAANEFNPQINPADIKPACLPETDASILTKQEEAQVEKAMADSKRVLENLQWKSIEKKFADVLNSDEKAKLRSDYSKAMSKMDWKVWEDKLRSAYNQVNWNMVNEQLSQAVNQIRIDSLQTVYSAVEAKLNRVQDALEENKVDGIPDSEISLKLVEERKKQTEDLLRSLKLIRNRKVVHL